MITTITPKEQVLYGFIEQLERSNKELLAACYAVLHDCDDLDMVPSNEPGRDEGPWLMVTNAIARATGEPK